MRHPLLKGTSKLETGERYVHHETDARYAVLFMHGTYYHHDLPMTTEACTELANGAIAHGIRMSTDRNWDAIKVPKNYEQARLAFKGRVFMDEVEGLRHMSEHLWETMDIDQLYLSAHGSGASVASRVLMDSPEMYNGMLWSVPHTHITREEQKHRANQGWPKPAEIEEVVKSFDGQIRVLMYINDDQRWYEQASWVTELREDISGIGITGESRQAQQKPQVREYVAEHKSFFENIILDDWIARE